MYGRFFPRALFGLLAIALIVGVGAYAYQLGLAQGAVQGAPAGAAGTVVAGPFWHRHMFFPFWGFGCLVPLFIGFVIFGVARMVFWRGHMMGHGPWRGRWSEGGVPPMVEEWHKRMHERVSEQKPADSTAPKPEGKTGK